VSLPTTDTVVLYPAGETRATASVLYAEPFEGGLAVVLDRTPAHPVDAAWPDQGPDRGVLREGGTEWKLIDCVVGATDGAALYLGDEIPVKKGTEGWAFLVVHVLPADAALEGDEVEVEVDAAHRAALSLGHTACHIASLALNRALAEAWRKEVRADALGAPDFDAVACERSTIRERGSLDEYRVGKSVRRAGFEATALDDLPALERAMAATLAGWVDSGAAVRIEREGDGLTDRRFWVCELPDGTARIPCGGTHATSLAELRTLEVALDPAEADGAVAFTMTTRAGV
jgi:alanyl-tRNA synthetase